MDLRLLGTERDVFDAIPADPLVGSPQWTDVRSRSYSPPGIEWTMLRYRASYSSS
jgi:hypothetical protein